MNKLKKATLHIIAARLDEPQIKSLRETFAHLDSNRDGFLTAAELREGLEKSDLKTLPPDLQYILDGMDTNQNNIIDYTEFLASALDEKYYLQEDMCWSAFKLFDRNGDGRVSVSELDHVLRSEHVEEAMGADVIQEVVAQVDANGD